MKLIKHLELIQDGVETSFEGSFEYMAFSFGYINGDKFIQRTKYIKCRELLSLIPICRHFKGFPEIDIYRQKLTSNLIRPTTNNQSTYILLSVKKPSRFKQNLHYLTKIEKDVEAIKGRTTIVETVGLPSKYIILRVPYLWYKNHLTLSLYGLLLRSLLFCLPEAPSLEEALSEIPNNVDVSRLNKLFNNLNLKIFLNNTGKIIPPNFYKEDWSTRRSSSEVITDAYEIFLRKYTKRGIVSFVSYLQKIKSGLTIKENHNPSVIWVNNYLEIEKEL